MLARLLGAWFIFAIVTIIPAMAADPPPIFVGGQFIREHAIQDDRGHLLVPVRGVFEALHARVAYTPPRFVVVRKNGVVVAGLIVGGHHAVVANVARNLSVAPIRRYGRVYVPLRIIAQIAGASVVYSAKPRLVDIHLPYNELALSARARDMPELPPDPTTPPWAYALVGAAVLGFAIELARRLAVVAQQKPAKRSSHLKLVPLTARPLQFPNAAATSDQHGVGQIGK